MNQTNPMRRDIHLDFFYEFPIEKVWKALTDSRALATWLMENDFQPVVGHKFQFRAQPMPGWNGIVDCEVLEVDEPHRLSYKWGGGDESHMNHTIVTWTLESTADGGTKLHLAHEGFEGEHGLIAYENLLHGWKHMGEGSFKELLATL